MSDLSSAPNIHYQKFFAKLKEVDTLPIKDWTATHVVGYFVKKYQEKFKVPFKFKLNSSSPSKCFEMFHIKKLGNNLSSDPKVLKQYIDWVFDNKLGKGRFTSISFITDELKANEFKFKYAAGSVKPRFDRSEALPAQYKEILDKVAVMNVFGDLFFFNQAVKSGGMDQETVEKFNQAMEKLKALDFDVSALDS